MAEKKEKSWELLRICSKYLEENEKKWRRGKQDEENSRKEQEEKAERLAKAAMKKEKCKKELKQRKITESMMKLPTSEKTEFLREEEKRRRLELQAAKENVWKKWRKNGKGKEVKNQQKRNEENEMDEKLDKIEQILERVNNEEEKKKLLWEREMERRKKVVIEKKKKAEEKKREEFEKNERREIKRKCEERWELLRWITQYIGDNEERWKKEKRERDGENEKILAEWEKNKIFEKIKVLKEKANMAGTNTDDNKEKENFKRWRHNEQINLLSGSNLSPHKINPKFTSDSTNLQLNVSVSPQELPRIILKTKMRLPPQNETFKSDMSANVDQCDSISPQKQHSINLQSTMCLPPQNDNLDSEMPDSENIQLYTD